MGDDGRAARAGLRVPVREAGPSLEDGAAAPVPRHPAGLLHRLGAPRGGGRIRPGGGGVGGPDQRGAPGARRGGDPGPEHQPLRAPRGGARPGRRPPVRPRARERQRPARERLTRPPRHRRGPRPRQRPRPRRAGRGRHPVLRPRPPRPPRSPRRPGQLAPPPHRPAQLLGRLGRGQALPQPLHGPAGRCGDHRRRPGPPAGLDPGRALLRQRLEDHPDRHPARRQPPDRLRDRDRLARDGEVPQGGLPGRHPRSALLRRDPVRPCPAAHAHEHHVGGGPFRGLRPPLGAPRRTRLRRRRPQ